MDIIPPITNQATGELNLPPNKDKTPNAVITKMLPTRSKLYAFRGLKLAIRELIFWPIKKNNPALMVYTKAIAEKIPKRKDKSLI